MDLYKELIAPFTGVTENTVPVVENLEVDQILVLAAPVQAEGRSIRIDDPIFPMEVIVPASYEQTCDAVLEILRREPVVQLEHLQDSIDRSLHTSLDPVLKWMLNAGILLRTRPMNPAIDPKLIGDQMAKPLFTIQGVDYRTDVFVIKQVW